MTIRSTPVQSHPSLLPWGLTACAVVAGPPLFGAAQTSPAVSMAGAAIALTVLVIAFALRQRKHHIAVIVPAQRRVRPLAWSPP